ncbi:dephospho-CoA kinase [Clostridium drakei]|uniref:Dephospho-CoA kinase n=1 Tax=Clostridium drakei TaxID=332101 RepID=A0A2U8DVF8_9CLOT|nr:dephospho-CoA kinase [Clostridium drakei]AWI06767.1 dephospho-CoA kinase [Clostridium drakei]
MLKIGLTGGIGSGKSTISEMFRKRGFNIIDADIVAREVLNKYPEIICGIKKNFGERFVDENDKLKRRELGDFIFAVQERRKKYEEIIMPFIIKEIFYIISELDKKGKEVCILDAATLIENNLHKYMDINILVWVDSSTQLERIKNRDKLPHSEILNRINSQMSLQEKIKFVDYTIDNSKSLENTEEELNITLKEIVRNFRGVKCLNKLGTN